MTYLIRISAQSNKVSIGDIVQFGDIVGKNVYSLEQIYSPIHGVVTDIVDGLNRHSIILVIESDVLAETLGYHGQNEPILVS